MITDDLFALKSETLRFFDEQASAPAARQAKSLMTLAMAECLCASRILALLGGASQTRSTIRVDALLARFQGAHLPVFRGVFAANRDLIILLGEQYQRAVPLPGPPRAVAARLLTLFREVIAANHGVLDRIRRQDKRRTGRCQQG